jgi:hypothetical protein
MSQQRRRKSKKSVNNEPAVREVVWRLEAAKLVAALGVAPVIHADEEAQMVTETLGVRACVIGDVLYIHPDVTPGSLEGRRLLVHQLVYLARRAAEPGRVAASA